MRPDNCLKPCTAFCKNQAIKLLVTTFIIFLLLSNVQTNCQTVDSTYLFSAEQIELLDSLIKENVPNEKAFICVQWMAANYIQTRQWEKATAIFEKYRPLFNRSKFKEMDERFEKIIGILNAPEEGLVISNLGSGINSNYPEYCPIPTADGLKLYFTCKGSKEGIGGEDIFVSEFIDGKWEEATILGSSINTESNESANAISADGNRLLLFGNYEESLGKGDIFYTDKTKNGWTKIQNFPEPINSKYSDIDAFITSDGKAILFTSDRPGGVGDFHKKDSNFDGHVGGNIDIYICHKTDTGWGKPINLGTTINTPYCERTPFLHADNRTLYFSSDGHYNLGHLDVFKAVRLSDTSWTEWGEPVNLGKEINTFGIDWSYQISTTGNVAYFSTTKNDGYGDEDIYSITLPATVRPEEVVTIRGTVTDQHGNLLEADIKWEDLSTGENVGQLKSNPQDGTYFIALPLGKNYGYYAEKKGYYPVSQNINLQDTTEVMNITENIVLVSIEEMREKEIAVRINNIFFDYDKYDIKPESFPELDRLAIILKQNQDAKIEIAGHTDDKGSDAYNIELSKRRAQAVVSYLCSTGCTVKNLVSRGYGEGNPVASNETEEGCIQNRRVEFRFVK